MLNIIKLLGTEAVVNLQLIRSSSDEDLNEIQNILS